MSKNKAAAVIVAIIMGALVIMNHQKQTIEYYKEKVKHGCREDKE